MYDINLKLDKKANKLSLDDLFNLMLIEKRKEGICVSFDYKNMASLFETYSKSKEFLHVFDYIDVDKEIGFDFRPSVKKNVKEKNISVIDDCVLITLTKQKADALKAKYADDVYLVFNHLIFEISKNLKFGYGKWHGGFNNSYVDPFLEAFEIPKEKIKKL